MLNKATVAFKRSGRAPVNMRGVWLREEVVYSNTMHEWVSNVVNQTRVSCKNQFPQLSVEETALSFIGRTSLSRRSFILLKKRPFCSVEETTVVTSSLCRNSSHNLKKTAFILQLFHLDEETALAFSWRNIKL